jgi:nucleoside-diphosphate-sugar epimerase
MKILITGYKGFVGRNFVKALQGHNLTLIDIKDGNDARDFFRTDDSHFDLLIHLAAVVGGRQMIEGNPLALAVDLSIDAEMASWAMRTLPGHILYFSSSAAYPVELQSGDIKRRLSENDINLKDIRLPDMTYGWAKLTGEMLCEHLRLEGLTVSVLRPFSGYGSDQDLSYPFTSFIDRAARLEDPFTIWGSALTVRDWIHISDIVEISLAMALDRLSITCNLATGRATAFAELATLVIKARGAGYKPRIEVDQLAPKGVNFRVGNPSFLKILGFEPKVPLEVGVAQALSVWTQA